VTAVSFTVYGVAAPAGSKKAFAHKHTGRIVVTDDSKRSRPWKTDIAKTAAVAMAGRPLLEGALELHILIYMPRPKGHYGTGRNAATLRASAPLWPSVKPDVTKLLRALEDACTGVVWRDDAQIVVQHATKAYGDPARAVIAAAPAPPPAAQAQLAAA
jgi:Holliday junction resolvase RusA-like endonuclease